MTSKLNENQKILFLLTINEDVLKAMIYFEVFTWLFVLERKTVLDS